MTETTVQRRRLSRQTIGTFVLGVFVAGGVVVLLALLAVNGVHSSHGHPTTGEVEGEVLAMGGRGPHVAATKCSPSGAAAWRCTVRYSDGSSGTVLAHWYASAKELGLSKRP